MGDPRKTRKKYQTPSHPWNRERIDEEKLLLKEFGMKNKKEAWKMEAVLRNAKTQAKKLSRTSTDQARMEEEALLTRLKSLGILNNDGGLNQILALGIRDVLDRRLQTRLFKQMLANSMKQSRQFITHEHVTVNGKTITSPSYLVSLREDETIAFHDSSSISDPEHPERVAAKKETPEEVELKAKAKDTENVKEEKKKVPDKKAAKESKVEDKEDAKEENKEVKEEIVEVMDKKKEEAAPEPKVEA